MNTTASVEPGLYAPNYGAPIEHAITRALVHELDKAGFVAVAVWDSEEYQLADNATIKADAVPSMPAPKPMSLTEVLDSVFSVEECTLHFAKRDRLDAWGSLGVLLIGGNKEDLISDWHCGDEAFNAAVERVCYLANKGALVLTQAVRS
jgi:hypothetical protein